MKFPSKKSFSLLQTIMSLFAVVAKKPTCSFGIWSAGICWSFPTSWYFPPGTENNYCETSLEEKQPRPAFF